MMSLSSSSSLSSYNWESPRPQRKRHRLELSNHNSKEGDSGDDDSLRGLGRTTATTSPVAQPPPKPRVTLSTQKKKNNDDDSDDSSVSTAELARRIRGESPAVKPKSTTREEVATASPSVDSANANNRATTSGSIRHSSSLETNFRNSNNEEDDDDDLLMNTNNNKDDDDDSSVSTMELARRIRGEPPPPTQSLAAVASTKHPGGAITTAAASKENHENDAAEDPHLRSEVIVAGEAAAEATTDENWTLPSPLPSSEDEESDDGEHVDDDDDGDTGERTNAHVPLPTDNKPSAAHNHDGPEYDDDDSVEIVVMERPPPPSQNPPSAAPIVREGLRTSPGPWARQRQLNATGALFSYNTAHSNFRPSWGGSSRPSREQNADIEAEEDIETYSDDDDDARPSRVRHVSNPSFAANVTRRVPLRNASAASGSRGFSSGGTKPRNDLTGGSGAGAGGYQMYAQQSTAPAEPTRGGSRKRGRRGGGGRGRGRRRGGGRGGGRGRGRGRGGGGGRGRTNNNYQQQRPANGNAWSDYSAQRAPWASSSQSSNLGNVGGAEISF